MNKCCEKSNSTSVLEGAEEEAAWGAAAWGAAARCSAAVTQGDGARLAVPPGERSVLQQRRAAGRGHQIGA